MSDDHSRALDLKARWDKEDAEREQLAARARQRFLEQEAEQLFEPIENYLARLGQLLRAAGASIEVDTNWEHLDDRKLRRVATVKPNESGQQLLLDFTIQTASISYRGKPYQFSRVIEALIPIITSDVEQFLTPLSRARKQTKT